MHVSHDSTFNNLAVKRNDNIQVDQTQEFLANFTHKRYDILRIVLSSPANLKSQLSLLPINFLILFALIIKLCIKMYNYNCILELVSKALPSFRLRYITIIRYYP